jgi:hypothetical protein
MPLPRPQVIFFDLFETLVTEVGPGHFRDRDCVGPVIAGTTQT